MLRLMLVLTLLAQQQPPPTFRGGINLITLDITAIGPDGWPVRDLKRDEIALSVNGHERAIKSFELIDVAAPRAAADKSAATSPAANVTAPASNVDTPGRSVFFVIMHEHICPGNERQALDGARAFIDQLEPRDRVAVITMPQGRVEVDLTTDHARAKDRLGRLTGHAESATGNQTTSEARALVDFVRGLAPLDGAKTIVLVSEGLNANEAGVFTPQDLAAVTGPEDITGATLLDAASATVTETTTLRGAAAAARAQFYVIRPNTVGLGCTGMGDPAARPTDVLKQERNDRRMNDQILTQESALATVASVTGGQYFSLSGRSTFVFDRILRETSAYYTIAFEADPQDLSGNLGKVVVRTTRPGVSVRTRVIMPKQPAPARATASTPEMATTSASYKELPLWLKAFPARGTNGQIKTPIVVDSLDRAWKEASFTLSDSKGKLVAGWRADAPLPAGPVVTAQSLAPGHYRLRVAAIDESGKRGTAEYEFDAKLQQAGPLALGALMLGSVNGGSFKPALVAKAGAEVTPYFEIYGTATSVSVAFTLTRAGESQSLVAANGDLTATRDADRHIATGSLPLGDLPAGDYTVRADISVGGKQMGLIASTLHVVRD